MCLRRLRCESRASGFVQIDIGINSGKRVTNLSDFISFVPFSGSEEMLLIANLIHIEIDLFANMGTNQMFTH